MPQPALKLAGMTIRGVFVYYLIDTLYSRSQLSICPM
ncbi:MAG: hypothetical protein K0Q59_1516 [Paenibacillus sp.]|nr:hypothetical protein [Paenibacillus sp.]